MHNLRRTKRIISALGGVLALGFVVIASETTVTAASAQSTEHVVKDLPLQSFFHTARPWQLKIYEKIVDGANASGGLHSFRVCFELPTGPGVPPPQCHAYKAANADIATLRTLIGPDGGNRPAVVINHTWSLGGGTIWSARNGIAVWVHPAVKDSGFWNVLNSTVGYYGMHKFVTTGPLAGSFIEMEQVDEGNEPSMASPRHYLITVYKPAKVGYVKVLSFLTAKSYPRPWPVKDPIASLTPDIERALKAVYPNGVYSSAVAR